MSGSSPAPAVALPARLIVTKPFGDYERGQEITDENAVARIFGSEQRAHVVPVAARQTAVAHLEDEKPEADASDHKPGGER